MANWYWGLGLLAVMAWVAVDAFTELLPWHLIDPTRPGRRRTGTVIIVILASALLTLYQELMQWVWMGIKHLLLIDVSEMAP